MTLPIDLVLVRHGQSEGNALKRRSEAGDREAFTEEFLRRHTASWRLTTAGRLQAFQAGSWLNKEFYGHGITFDRLYTSNYYRAMETAAGLKLPDASWYQDFYLTERDWGDLDKCTDDERQEKFGDALKRREDEPFFWRAPNGERFVELCLRVDRHLSTLHNSCSDKRVCIVCHGEVMRAFQVRIERLSQERFRELHLSENSDDRIHNCQIIHYSRRNPKTKAVEPYCNWVRMVRPTVSPAWDTGWRQITRSQYSNEDLLAIVSQVESMVR